MTATASRERKVHFADADRAATDAAGAQPICTSGLIAPLTTTVESMVTCKTCLARLAWRKTCERTIWR